MQIRSDGQKWTDQPKTPTYICSEISQHLFLSFKNLNATYRGKGKCGMTACFYGWICWVMPKNRIWIFLIFVGMNVSILEKCGFSIGSFCECVCFATNASSWSMQVNNDNISFRKKRLKSIGDGCILASYGSLP